MLVKGATDGVWKIILRIEYPILSLICCTFIRSLLQEYAETLLLTVLLI